MAKDNGKEAAKAQPTDQSIPEAIFGKKVLSVLDCGARANLLAGAAVLALGAVLVAVSSPAINGSSAAGVVGWGAVFLGTLFLVRGLSQQLWPVKLSTLEAGVSADGRSPSQEKRDVVAMALFAALLFLPWLGAVGLWDPWEVHYGEVARTMVVKRDLVYPYWESAYFFSKPPLTMWLQALGIAATGGTADNAPLGLYIEWGMRLPFALLSILAVAMITLAIGRIFGRRAGLIAGFATATCPLYFMLARQAVTDTPFVALLVAGLSCFMLAELDPAVRGELNPSGSPKTGGATVWWCWAYAFFGLATLAKGLLGFGLPGIVLLIYLLLTWDWKLLRRARLLHGLVIFVLIAVPWILVLSLFPGVDDESKTFAYRFFIHDHFNRLTAGVHTTTPGGTFTYFIEQLGFAMFPWVALVPGAMVAIGRLVPRDPDPKNRAALLVTIWAAASFFIFAFSATKFHHYCFPVVPPLAILCALWADRLWKEGVDGNAVPILLGIGFFAAVGQNLWMEPKVLPNMFIYNYDRTYPSMPELAFSFMGFHPTPKEVFAVLFIGGGLWLALAYLWRAKAMLVGTFAAVSLLFAGYISYIHWEKLTPHWTQRELLVDLLPRPRLAQRAADRLLHELARRDLLLVEHGAADQGQHALGRGDDPARSLLGPGGAEPLLRHEVGARGQGPPRENRGQDLRQVLPRLGAVDVACDARPRKGRSGLDAQGERADPGLAGAWAGARAALRGDSRAQASSPMRSSSPSAFPTSCATCSPRARSRRRSCRPSPRSRRTRASRRRTRSRTGSSGRSSSWSGR